MNSTPERQDVEPASVRWFADACGEIPIPEVIVYNIRRLRSIGYLSRFGHYLTQVGLRAEEIAGLADMSFREIEYAVESAGERTGWRADPEAHLIANGCKLLLVVGERPSAIADLTPLDPAKQLTRLESTTTDIRLFVGADPGDIGSFHRDLELASHSRFAGFALSPFMSGLPVDHPDYAPILKVIADRGLAVWVHSSAHFRPDVCYDIAHPRHMDAILIRYPGLRAIFGHAGWPWTIEACIVALRHGSTALEFSTFPPSLIGKPGFALSPLIANAKSLKGRIFFGSGATFSSKRMGRLLSDLDLLAETEGVADWRGEALTTWMRRAA